MVDQPVEFMKAQDEGPAEAAGFDDLRKIGVAEFWQTPGSLNSRWNASTCPKRKFEKFVNF